MLFPTAVPSLCGRGQARYTRFSIVFLKNERDTAVSHPFFSKTNEIHPYLNHFSSKRAKHTRFSSVFSKTSEIPPFLMLFLQNKPTRFFCFRHRFLTQQTRETAGLQAGDGGKRRKGDGQGLQKAWATCLNRRGYRRSD